MIVSASYRTDIPAFYAGWFLRRLRAGYCRVANPYGGGSYEVSIWTQGKGTWPKNARRAIHSTTWLSLPKDHSIASL